MNNENDWLWDLIICPQCNSPLIKNEPLEEIICTNLECVYTSTGAGKTFNLLPHDLDQQQHAEHDFRQNIISKFSVQYGWMDSDRFNNIKLLNTVCFYSFTSQYYFFRDHFSKIHHLQGKGLEIGGASGFSSGFIKLFYADTQMVMSDIAPVNIQLANELAERLKFQTDYFVAADAERPPFLPESFDFLFSSGMLHHLGNLPTALRKGYEILKPGGKWYIVNELSIGSLPRMIWNSRWGKKGKWAKETGIREHSYTFQDWIDFFQQAHFIITEVNFYRNPKHKLQSWWLATYYAFISKLPISLIKIGLPCEVNFVLQRPE